DQWFSWITLRDEVSAILHVIGDDSVSGALNAAAPNPVTNALFTQALGRALHRPTPFAVPRPMLHLVLGRELAEELALTSQRVLPAKLESSGFEFLDPVVGPALAGVLGAR
ncbi:MAG: DUF1731 domain-containing protein, partial [Acidimicrobiales bacterium]